MKLTSLNQREIETISGAYDPAMMASNPCYLFALGASFYVIYASLQKQTIEKEKKKPEAPASHNK